MRIILFCISAALIVGCSHSSQRVNHTSQTVEVAYAKADSIVNRMSFISTLQPNYIAVVQPRVNGYLSAKLFSNGMPVKRGDVIFRIDSRQQIADMLAAKAALTTAQANVIEAENNYKRAVPLAAIDAISQAQLDQYTAQFAAAQATVASAEQQLKNAELQVEYTTIRATINGVISASEAYSGDYVGPNTKFATLTRIENIDTLCAEVAIPMSQYLELSGRKAFSYNNKNLLSDIELYLADGKLYPIKGAYSYTKSAVADAEGTIILVVTFPNPNYLLKSGQFARVVTDVGTPQYMVTIPKCAINQIQGTESVWVVGADSTVQFRKVTTIKELESGDVAVLGLTAGQAIVKDGSARLSNNQKVNLQ